MNMNEYRIFYIINAAMNTKICTACSELKDWQQFKLGIGDSMVHRMVQLIKL